MTRPGRVGVLGLVMTALLLQGGRAAAPGLPFTEDFNDTNLRDAARTNADWSTEKQALLLAWRQRHYGTFGATVTGSDVSDDMVSADSVALGDVDGDGDLDLVVGVANGPNRLYLNNGTADPWIGVTGSDISADADFTYSVALGDVDGDGDLDLVAGNIQQPNRLYLNNGTADPWGGVKGSNISDDVGGTHSVALGDVDGDGDLDLVAGNSPLPSRLYLNNGTSDPWSGAVGSNISDDLGDAYSVALGDVDGDGHLDLVVGNYDQPNRLYLNNGSADPWGGVAGSDITADSDLTFSVALGDVDGDGDLDLVVGNYAQNRLYLNNGTSDPWGGVAGIGITSDANFTRSVALGDVDGDGDLDLVAGNFNQPDRLYINNGSSDPWGGVVGTSITADTLYTTATALGDVDGDGDLDLVAGTSFNQPNRLYLNDGTTSPWNGGTGSNLSADTGRTLSIALGDVDRDGDLDLVAGRYGQTNRLYLNNGTSDPWNGVVGSDISTDAGATEAVALADVDGDGHLDLVVGNLDQPNRLYLNNGTSNPWNGVTGSDITSDAGSTDSVALGDVDGDGDLDLVAGNRGQPNRLYMNNGTTDPWAGVGGSDITSDADATSFVTLGDVDGDGDLDLVAGNAGQANRLYLNNGTADPWNGVAGSDITSDSDSTSSVALGDVDRDGDLDLVAGNAGQANRLYLNNGTADPWGGVVGYDITAEGNATDSVVLGDVDGDGDLDLIAGN
ncbi:MAG TPA: VCBS repeat-containing protein, partial [Candidatus Polarisedimenticolia bacterium]|nr:VCBS repeat-containing protein [Candidatus Polarisedimenticolia bacterium]